MFVRDHGGNDLFHWVHHGTTIGRVAGAGGENGDEKRRMGNDEACVFLRTEESTLPIVSRWGIWIGNYWRGFFSFFL